MTAITTPRNPRRFNATQAVCAMLGLLNVAMITAGTLVLSGYVSLKPGASGMEKATHDAEHHSQELASKVFTGTKDLKGLIAASKALEKEGVTFELAAQLAEQPKVIAASDPALVGQVAQGGLLETLKGHKPDGEIDLAAPHQRGSLYIAYYAQKLGAADGEAAPIAPAPVKAPPSNVLRVIKRTVQKQVPTPAQDYVIKAGDTLYQISRDRYGDETMFYKIWEANKGAIPDRSNLPVGTTIRLPEGAGRTVEQEENVVVGQAEPPKVVAGESRPAAVQPTEVALKLAVPVAHGGVMAMPTMGAKPRRLVLALGLAAALIAGFSWALALVMLDRQRRRQLEDQKADLLEVVGDHLAPHPQPFDRSQLRSSWQVEHAQAVLPGDEPGGSFTDVQVFSDAKLGLFIGDATGWNASALVERGLANAFWRARASEQLSPAQTLLDVNHLLVDYIAQGDHVTAFYAQVDLLSGAITYSSAAHTGAYVLGRRGGLTMLITRGMPLGVGRELFTDRLEEGHVRLQEGESLLLLTDGVLKAENANGEPFGVERLEKCLRDRPGCDADAVVATIRDALHQFVGGDVLLDESAIVCLRLVNPLVLYPVRVVEPVGAGEAAEHS